MTLAPGTSLGPDQIESPIGAGGMREVYKATDTRLERTVAIRVLPAHVASDPERKSRFEREARTVAALRLAEASLRYTWLFVPRDEADVAGLLHAVRVQGVQVQSR